MKVSGATIQQLDRFRPDGRELPKSECRRWRLWATTEQGRKSKRFKGTYSKAQKALSAWVSELEGIVPNDETFASYAASWHRWRVASAELSPGTYENERRNVTALCRTELAGMRMDALTPEACREAIVWLKEHPARDTESGKLTNTTMNKIVQTLKMVTRQAYDDGKIARDPMDKIMPPRCDTEEREALSPSELVEFLDGLDGRKLDGRTMALYLMACLGLRRGEAIAVMDADISDGLCRVRFAVKERDNSLDKPKTPAGVRTLPVPARLQAKVDEFRAVRREKGWDCPTLCCNTHGERMTMQPFQKWWAKERVKMGYPDMGMHQLRHSNLSMVSRHMSVFDLQAYAGWSSLEPAKVYIHRDLDSVTRSVSEAWDSIECTNSAPPEEEGQEP